MYCIRSVRIAIYINNFLLVVGNTNHLKSKQKRTKINLPGGQIEIFDSNYIDAILRETREELGLIIPPEIFKKNNIKFLFGDQMIFELHCTEAEFFEWLSKEALSPWERSGISLYNIDLILKKNEDKIVYGEKNKQLTEKITSRLIKLNRKNLHATETLHKGKKYSYWKNNYIIRGFKSSNEIKLILHIKKMCKSMKDYNFLQMKNYNNEKCQSKNQINWELYRYLDFKRMISITLI